MTRAHPQGSVKETMDMLAKARERTDSVLVSFSAGKDSLVVLDLCLRTFSRVECFFMYFVRGLRCVEDPLFAAADRFGVKLHLYPHWSALRALKYGAFCWQPQEVDDWPDYKLRDIYATAMEDTGITLIATGAKRSDSLWRKRNLDSTKNWEELISPIVGWSKHEVLEYLLAKKIPVPKGSGLAASGVGLVEPEILWLADNHPDDYQRLLEVFPFAGAYVARRGFYGR